MKIAIAQLSSTKGPVTGNLEKHLQWIELAANENADLIVFPELSLTNYEPTIAKDVAIDKDHLVLDKLDDICLSHHITVLAGVPLLAPDGINIALMIFSPGEKRSVYAKKFLHPDEESFFVGGNSPSNLSIEGTNIGLAICYEISVDKHMRELMEHGAQLYIASVAKFKRGIDKALQQLSSIARENHIPVCMGNAVGVADGEVCAGRSSVWNPQGEVLAEMNDVDEGFIFYDTVSGDVEIKLVS